MNAQYVYVNGVSIADESCGEPRIRITADGQQISMSPEAFETLRLIFRCLEREIYKNG